MIREERLAKITEYVQNRHYASIEELVEMLGVSKATVRRDVLALSKSNAVVLTRGGITCDLHDRNRELAYNEKRYANAAEKNRLAQTAGRMIRPDMTIIIDAGTTTRSMVPFLREIKGLNLVTNDLMIAADVTDCEGISVTVTGGQLRRDFYTLRGYAAEDFVRHMRADIAFVGFDAVDIDSGCYITNADEVALKKCMIASADKVVALCDYTKFSNTAFISVCQLSDLDVIITNKELDMAEIEALRQMDVEVILA
ncbi:MAG TPA: DeoR/GlpR family DNA-binding transcription regulator [Clostridia bacterium]|nr:DeoR/GlpR family DNA-binding transcription regulator [Clostridia bacterium]